MPHTIYHVKDFIFRIDRTNTCASRKWNHQNRKLNHPTRKWYWIHQHNQNFRNYFTNGPISFKIIRFGLFSFRFHLFCLWCPDWFSLTSQRIRSSFGPAQNQDLIKNMRNIINILGHFIEHNKSLHRWNLIMIRYQEGIIDIKIEL